MKKAVIFGAGNIGRGFIGELFSESGYKVVFIDVDNEKVNRINDRGCYTIKVVSQNNTDEKSIENIEAIKADEKNSVAKAICQADIMATAVGVNALSAIVPAIIAGFRLRWQENNFAPLNIIICENKIDADKYLSSLIKEELSADEIKYFEKTAGLIKASIGRMVPEISNELKEKDPLLIMVEPYNELPVDKDGFKGQIPEIKNMVPFSPFSFYIERKLFIHNMAHALTAYLGNLYDYQYIWQAVRNPFIKFMVSKAIQESSTALSREHEVDLFSLLFHGDQLLYRFNNKVLADTVGRVGQDTYRKLGPDDRLAGAVKLCLKHDIMPVYIFSGLAGAILFSLQSESGSSEYQVEKRQKEQGVRGVLEKIAGLENQQVIKNTEKFFRLMKEKEDCQQIMLEAEKMVFADKVN